MSAAMENPRVQRTAGRGRSILVVDDNRMMRDLVRVTLESEGYTVLEAPDGWTAIDLMAERRPALVLQDMVLPDMNGRDLVKQLRSLPGGTEVPILAFSGFLPTNDRMANLQAGFTDYLLKPVEPSRLVQTIQAYLPPHGSEARPGAGRRVVAADDDPSQLRLLQLHLERLGFEVQTARDGAEALKLTPSSPPDAVLSDVLMPRMDGFRLCREIRRDPRIAQVPVLLLTSLYNEEADLQLAREVGANHLALRTPDVAKTGELLLECLAQRSAVSAAGEVKFPLNHYSQRVVRQLERQVGANVHLTQRLSVLEARFSVLVALTKSLKDTALAQRSRRSTRSWKARCRPLPPPGGWPTWSKTTAVSHCGLSSATAPRHRKPRLSLDTLTC
ncbi:MAG: response regulator [Chloroflexota bacterium]